MEKLAKKFAILYLLTHTSCIVSSYETPIRAVAVVAGCGLGAWAYYDWQDAEYQKSKSHHAAAKKKLEQNKDEQKNAIIGLETLVETNNTDAVIAHKVKDLVKLRKQEKEIGQHASKLSEKIVPQGAKIFGKTFIAVHCLVGGVAGKKGLKWLAEQALIALKKYARG